MLAPHWLARGRQQPWSSKPKGKGLHAPQGMAPGGPQRWLSYVDAEPRETLPTASWNRGANLPAPDGAWSVALLQTQQVSAVSWIQAEAGDSEALRLSSQLYYTLAVRRGGEKSVNLSEPQFSCGCNGAGTAPGVRGGGYRCEGSGALS